MKKFHADDYMKVVEWSRKDQCFIGSAPPLIGPCCHGKNEEDVYRQLREIVKEWVELYNSNACTLPKRSSGKQYSGKFILRLDPTLHHYLAVKAMQEGDSLNSYCAKILKNHERVSSRNE